MRSVVVRGMALLKAKDSRVLQGFREVSFAHVPSEEATRQAEQREEGIHNGNIIPITSWKRMAQAYLRHCRHEDEVRRENKGWHLVFKLVRSE